MLIIKWEPRDVYLACALEDARGHVQTTAVMFDHNICVVRTIESLIRTVYDKIDGGWWLLRVFVLIFFWFDWRRKLVGFKL